jgi:nitroreductase
LGIGREQENMELLEAINSRMSIRGFTPDPVPKEVLFELLRVATRSPSGVNCQPWELYIVVGEALKELGQAYVGQFRQGIKPHPVAYAGQTTKGVSPALKGVYRERQVQLAKQMFQILGIKKGDDKKLREYYEKMYRFYDAPAVIIITADESLLIPSVSLDIGLLTQTIALAAQAYGLGSCVMRAIVDYPTQARDIVKIPYTKQPIIGVAIGYPDWDDPLNTLRTERESLEKILTWVGEA